MTECELKYMISHEEYLSLLHGYMSGAVTVPQVNYYYDTPSLVMNGAGITCRIRERHGHYTATVKVHSEQHSGESTEHSKAVRDAWDTSLFTPFGVSYCGSLMTDRTAKCPTGGIVIMLDRNTYLGTVDFEIEIEHAKEKRSEAEAVARQLASEAGFELRPSRLSKSERFFRKLLESNRNTNDTLS